MHFPMLLSVLIIVALAVLLLWPRRKKVAPQPVADQHKAPPTAPPAPQKSPAPTPPPPLWPQSNAAPGSDDAIWESGARALMLQNGRTPDAILHCIVQAGGDGPGCDFNDMFVGAFRDEKFLRLVMRDQDEEDYDPAEHLHAWDVPFSEIVAVICRERTKPGYPRLLGFQASDLEGEHLSNAPYLQTRVYKVTRGMECRLLDREQPRSRRPFDWLKENLRDPDVRFETDSADNPIYGDTLSKVVGDSLDEYALALKSRADAAEDAALSQRALALSEGEVNALRTQYGEDLSTFSAEFDRWFKELTGDSADTVPAAARDYAKTVAERVLTGAFPKRRFGIFFYDNFPAHLGTSAAVKAKLLQVVRWIGRDNGLKFKRRDA